jgi:hypothetical protein
MLLNAKYTKADELSKIKITVYTIILTWVSIDDFRRKFLMLSPYNIY